MRKYSSSYSPGKLVTAAQYIAELICERRATSLQRNLPIHFWKFKEWKQYYLYQIRLTYPLLEKYDEKAIIDAVRNDKAFSLKNPWLIRKIQKLDNQIKKQKPVQHKTFERNSNLPLSRPEFKTNTILDNLDKIDGHR